MDFGRITMQNHIFFIFHNLSLGGIQRKIVDMVNYISTQPKYSHIIPHVIVRENTKFTFSDKLQIPPSQIHYQPLIEPIISKRFNRVVYPIFLIYLFIKYNPKSIISFLHHSSGYVALVRKLIFWEKTHFVIGQDNIMSFENKSPYAIKTYPKWLLKYIYSQADKIIAQSASVEKDLINNYQIPKNKIKVLPNWVRYLRPKKFIKKYDLIYAGRFSPQKKLTRLLQVVNQIKKNIPNISLLLVGEGSDEKIIEDFIKKNNLSANVTIKKTSHQIERLMQQAKIFVLTSEFEGHPITLLEAMSLKVVPVVLNYPSACKQIKHSHTGFVENSQSNMASTIIKLLQNNKLRNKIATQARQDVLDNNSLKLIIDKYLKVILGQKYEV